MAIVPGDYHKLATELWNGTPPLKTGEPCSRTIVGRAYYCAYLTTRKAAREVYNIPTLRIPHEPLWKFLINESNNSVLRQIGNILKSLHTLRTDADYSLDDSMSRAHAETALEDSLEIANQFDDIKSELKQILPKKVPGGPEY